VNSGGSELDMLRDLGVFFVGFRILDLGPFVCLCLVLN
jgi:hypothetical protein